MWGGNAELMNIIRREVHRVMAMTAQPRFATISAYDPNTYMVKAQIQPEGHETSWFPVGSDHIGAGFGVLHGPKIGDQIEVSFQEGDTSSPRMVRRVFSEKEKPPKVESGELLVRHENGGFLFFDKNGNITLQDKSGGKLVFDGAGNLQIETSGKVTLKSGEIITDGTTKLDGGGPAVVTTTGPASRVSAKV